MLVLSRPVGTSVVIGEGPSQVTVSILQYRNGAVRVGVDAPEAMAIRRVDGVKSEQEPKP